jgi:Nuclease-related domain
MIIKLADDKQRHKSELQQLLSHPAADTATKARITQELRNIQAGIRGEDEAAYEMKVHYGESPNWMIIHDLRIVHGGLVAQIDHLLINRLLEVWVCESKHFSEGVAINEHGEFSAFFGSKPYGVPSPIQQNNRHILILKRLFQDGVVKLPTRLGFTIKPELKSLILVSKGARISRPKVKIDGLDSIIKNDSLFSFINKSVDAANPLLMAKLIGHDTLENLALAIAELHQPIEVNWRAKFALTSEPPGRDTPNVAQPVQATAIPVQQEPAVKQRLICKQCNVPVAYNVAKFCWFNKPKFGGNIYCIDCQKMV